MSHRNRLRHTLASLLSGLGAAASLVVTTAARADDDGRGRGEGVGRTHIAVDFDFANAVDTPGTKVGAGGALRVGREFDLFVVSLTPELGGGYHAFGGNDDTQLYSGFVGGRLAVGKVIEPAIFAHLGIGHVTGLTSRTAPIMDVGLALDFTLLPLIDVGVHGGYNVMMPRDDGSALKFLTLGVHAALVF